MTEQFYYNYYYIATTEHKNRLNSYPLCVLGIRRVPPITLVRSYSQQADVVGVDPSLAQALFVLYTAARKCNKGWKKLSLE